MSFHRVAALAAAVALFTPAHGQTWTKCNPLKTSCPPDPALGDTLSVDFTAGQSTDFTGQGHPTYGPDGAEFTVAKSGDAPTLISDWYIMFGRVDITMKVAPGNGIVSSFVMQSDDLDEIDVEWIGAVPDQVQTNFFGKGFTGTYNRGANFNIPDSETDFHTYTVDWNSERINWMIDGQILRTVVPSDFPGQYPQTPMQLKFGTWAGGDPTTNSPGTVQWAHGPVDWSAGPFTMTVQSIKVEDYSTGTQYKYGGNSGSWQSIIAVGGQVNADGTGSNPAPTSSATSSATTLSTATRSQSPGTPSATPSYPAPPVGGAPTGYGYTPSPTGSTPTKPTTGTMSPIPGNGAGSGKQVAWGVSLVCAFIGVMGAL